MLKIRHIVRKIRIFCDEIVGGVDDSPVRVDGRRSVSRGETVIRPKRRTWWFAPTPAADARGFLWAGARNVHALVGVKAHPVKRKRVSLPCHTGRIVTARHATVFFTEPIWITFHALTNAIVLQTFFKRCRTMPWTRLWWGRRVIPIMKTPRVLKWYYSSGRF